MEQAGRLGRGDGVALAWSHLPGDSPTIVFLPGFQSDMSGSKALFLRDLCAKRGQAMLRLDYSGHGASGGAFTDGTIGRWTEDAASVMMARVEGPMILVGSSMGGWIALLLALRFTASVAGLIGIATAPDFTETLIWDGMTPAERVQMAQDGQISAPSDYGEPYVITRRLIEEGRQHLLLGGRISLNCPVRLLQGQLDPDVPWETALKLAAAIDTTDVRTILIKDGDHRLSRRQDLALLADVLAALLSENTGKA